MGFRLAPATVACAIGLVIWFVIPVPEGVAPNAWHLLALFVATIAAFYGAGIALGAPVLPFALLMAAASNIMMTLTHYATGTSPVIFGSGYTTLGEWWKAGFAMSLVLIMVWVVVGSAWWRLLGYW